MFGKGIRLFSLFGFEVRLDPSWLILGFLITWSLAKGLFPFYFRNFAASVYWWMGVAGALGLLISIVFHELSHSLVAKRFGMPMRGITLFIFGGVAEMEDEPPSAKAELLMALAGPFSSVVFSGMIFLVLFAGKELFSAPVGGVLGYLMIINIVLAVFNLIPAFPLDGGRVLRAVLWQWKKNMRWATRVASAVGALFGLVLMILGVVNALMGNVLGGIWQVMIGMFLRGAAHASYRQLIVRKALEGDSVRRFMKTDPVTVPPTITIEEMVEEYVYKYHYKMFPVIEQGKLTGCISTRQLREVPREQWRTMIVRDAVNICSPENMVKPDTDAVRAWSLMNRTGNSRVMVVEEGKLLGVVTLKDIMSFLTMKFDLEDEAA